MSADNGPDERRRIAEWLAASGSRVMYLVVIGVALFAVVGSLAGWF